ncbi:MAG: hypothetical protein UIH27_11945 [Ruminococcus sp.]|nr:hypothetical protein [Ruminococcus sp.]
MTNEEQISRQLNEVAEAFHKFATAVAEAFRNFIEQLVPTCQRLARILAKDQAIILLTVPPEVQRAAPKYPKLWHLARYARKKRVRKKNLKRLYKLGKRGG